MRQMYIYPPTGLHCHTSTSFVTTARTPLVPILLETHSHLGCYVPDMAAKEFKGNRERVFSDIRVNVMLKYQEKCHLATFRPFYCVKPLLF